MNFGQQTSHLRDILNSVQEIVMFREGEQIQEGQLQFQEYNHTVQILSKNPCKNLMLTNISNTLINTYELEKIQNYLFQENQKPFLLRLQQLGTNVIIKQINQGRQFDYKKFSQLSQVEKVQIQNEIINLLSKIHSYDLISSQQYFSYQDYVENLRCSYKQLETKIQTNIEDLIYWFQMKSLEFLTVKETFCLGDVNLSNFIFDSKQLKIVDLANWENFRVGNPQLELAKFLLNYEIPHQKNIQQFGLQNIWRIMGLKSKDDLINQYLQLRRLDTQTQIELDFMLAFLEKSIEYQFKLKNEKGVDLKQQYQLELDILSRLGWNKILQLTNDDPFNIKKRVEIDKILWSNFPVSQRCISYYYRVRDFMRDEVFPLEKSQFDIVYEYNENNHWKGLPGIVQLQSKAKQLGLWNLFIGDPIYGKGLNNLEYAFISELMGTSFFGHEIFNCYAPETGNIKLLIMAGTPQQKEKYLRPLLEGECKTFFAMSEKNVASSDPTNFETIITKQGDGYLIKGTKWMVSGIKDERCKFGIIMGKTKVDPKSPFTEQTMFLVDMPNPNIKMRYPLSVLGYDEAPHGLFEVEFDNVYVPKENMLGQEGTAFAMSQGRLLGGRLHHSVRLLGLARRSIDVVLQRVEILNKQDKKFKYDTSFQERLGRIECEYQICKTMILNAAMILDSLGSRHMSSLKAVSETKAFVPYQCQCIVDECISLFGVKGITDEYILNVALKACRGLRMMDGPCELHKKQVSRFTQGSHLFNDLLNIDGYQYGKL